ncbi:MAG: DUF4040 domain-containing protein [Sciscionella sp.]|nr:DUF4040 domain-containing protein [Sciscionella sp.]
MTPLIVITLALVTAGGTATALIADPVRQAIALTVYGVLLVVLFMVLQAPDVALAELGVGSAIVPLMVLLTVRKIHGGPPGRRR